MQKKTDTEQKNSKKTVDKQSVTKPITSKEYGGPKGLEPTRYGDWEHKGRCIDF
ncbi:MAG: hypothetical protein ACI9XC_000555 [Gammaproteobacteria bacterium]|jgi:hypothetical protein